MTSLPRRGAAAAAVAILIAACGPAGSSATPSGTEGAATASAAAVAVLGRDWQKVDAVEAPPGNGATPPPYENPDSLGHPMHYQGGQADIVDVAPLGDGFVAGGFLETAAGPRAAVWSSTDGRRWALVAGFPASNATLVRAVVAGARGVVAVGADGALPATWHSSDGRAWERSSSPALSDFGAGELESVVATSSGFIAAGRAGGLGTQTRAAFWSSPDGIAWTRQPDGPYAVGARVEALAGDTGRWVAVGLAVEGTSISGGAIWTSTDGATWARVASPQPAFGPLHAVTAADDGFIAVGTNVAGTTAIVWRSPDGVAWQPVPDSTALDNYGLQIEMRDVAAVGDGYVAVGHLLFGTQFPSGVIWASSDGIAWTRAADTAMFQQAKLFGVAANGGQAAAVGTFGSPDFAIPTVWVSPPRG